MKRRADVVGALSLDSFLDIVTNVVGVLILIAVVTVISAGDISVSSGATALKPAKASAERVVFHCLRDRVMFVDEVGNAKRVREAAREHLGREPKNADELMVLLEDHDIGDKHYRLTVEILPQGLTWLYTPRSRAKGERADSLDTVTSVFGRKLREIQDKGGFVYFVVEEGGFEVFRAARELARERGVPVGWHPVQRRTPLRLGTSGKLGKKIQ